MSGEKWKIQTGDVIELIPGHYVFKYVSASNNTEESVLTTTRGKRPLNEESSKGKDLARSRKRMQKIPEEEALFRNSNVLPLFLGFLLTTFVYNSCFQLLSGPGLQDVLHGNDQEPNTSSEGIRHFQISKNKLPSTFRLLRVKELPEWANTNSVSINDVIQVRVLH